MKKDALLAECDFKAVRSSGPGGQHVNKTSTKIVLRWNLQASQAIDADQRARLSERLAHRLTKDQVLILTNDQGRSQHKNKKRAIQQFYNILNKGLEKPKRRKQTTPSKRSKLKRLQHKKQQAEKKTNRKPPKF